MTGPTVERRQRTCEATTHDDKLQRLYGAMDGCLSVQAQRRIVEVVGQVSTNTPALFLHRSRCVSELR